MKAIVQDRFGPPEVLRLADADVPQVGARDVLVQVRAAAVNPYDWHLMRGDPKIARLMGVVGLAKPKSRSVGIDVAGVVSAVGPQVPDLPGLRPGDEVFGLCQGAFAEFACADTDRLVPKPAGLSFEHAAALPMAATTALIGVRDVADVQAGQRVLVNGAAGGIGTCAVQIAAALGAEVTGVCSSSNVDLVRSLGAAHVVDYTADDFTQAHGEYDVVLDNQGNRPLRQLRRVLTPTGTLVLNGGGAPGTVVGPIGLMLRAALVNTFVRQRLVFLPTAQAREHLLAVADLVTAGKLAPVVGRTYPLVDTAEAVRHVEQGHARGKVVVTVG